MEYEDIKISNNHDLAPILVAVCCWVGPTDFTLKRLHKKRKSLSRGVGLGAVASRLRGQMRPLQWHSAVLSGWGRRKPPIAERRHGGLDPGRAQGPPWPERGIGAIALPSRESDRVREGRPYPQVFKDSTQKCR